MLKLAERLTEVGRGGVGDEAVWIGSFEDTSEGFSSSSEQVLPEIGSCFPWYLDTIQGPFPLVGCSSITELIRRGLIYCGSLAGCLPRLFLLVLTSVQN